MRNLTTILEASFYTEPLMIICALFAFFIGLIHRNRFKELRFMPLYALSSIVQISSLYYAIFYNPKMDFDLERMTSNIFILVESAVLYNFFSKVIVIKSLKTIVNILFLAFLAYVMLLWSLSSSFYHHPARLYLPEALCILGFCLLYFFQLFRLPPKLLLLSSPTFWVTTGCLFYFSCTIPLFFVELMFPLPTKIFAINYFAYSIFFLLIAKSFLCQPAQAK